MLWSAAYGHGRRDSGGGVLVQAGGDAMAIDVFWAQEIIKVGMNRCRARGNKGDGASVGSNGCHRGIAAGNVELLVRMTGVPLQINKIVCTGFV